jgi:hypothetical protein
MVEPFGLTWQLMATWSWVAPGCLVWHSSKKHTMMFGVIKPIRIRNKVISIIRFIKGTKLEEKKSRWEGWGAQTVWDASSSTEPIGQRHRKWFWPRMQSGLMDLRLFAGPGRRYQASMLHVFLCTLCEQKRQGARWVRLVCLSVCSSF